MSIKILKKSTGLSTLVLIFVIASLLALIVLSLQLGSLLASRRVAQIQNSQTAFFAAEGAMYRTIQILEDNPNWPASFPYQDQPFAGEFGEARFSREITETPDPNCPIRIDITSTVKGTKRRLVTCFGRSKEIADVLDVILIIDRSGSMDGGPLDEAKEAAIAFIDNIEQKANETGVEHHIGLVSYSDTLKVDHELSPDYDSIKEILEITDPGDPRYIKAEGWTNIGGGINYATQEMDDKGRPDTVKVFVVLSDGVANRAGIPPTTQECDSCPPTATNCTNYAIDQADEAKNPPREWTVFSVFLNNIDEDDCRQVGRETMFYISSQLDEEPTTPIPTEPPPGVDIIYTYYKETEDETKLEEIYEEIADFISSPSFFIVEEKIPEPETSPAP